MQYASQEESKEEERSVKQVNELAEFDTATTAAYQKLLTKVSYMKPDSNSFCTAFRLFTVPYQTEMQFPCSQYLRQHIGRGVRALYIFRLHYPHKEGFTHGMHIRLHGFVPRRSFESFNDALIKVLAKTALQLKAYVPIFNKSMSLFDYLQTLYVLPCNLLVNFSHHLDVISDVQKLQRPDTKESTAQRLKIQGMTCAIIENMVSMPSKFPTSYLFELLSMDTTIFKRHLRGTSMQEIIQKVAQDAYSLCLQDKKLKQNEVQEFMEPMTRRAMLNKCLTSKVMKQIQTLLQQQYTDYFVHPHPYNRLYKSNLSHMRPIDGIVFDPSFLFTVLLVSRWFAKTCLVDEKHLSNNNAHLLLYGQSGSGKSLLISTIASAIPTYKYLTDSRFQNPDILQSSLLTMEELDTSLLPENKYKQLLDIKQHVKVDFKNLNPENCTEGIACMMSTNDDIFSKLRGSKRYNKESVEAALRRLYIVPLKTGKYEKLHGKVPKDSPHWKNLLEHDFKFEEEPDILARLFNLIVAFGLFQQDIKGIRLEQRIHSYFDKITREFAYTAFGTFYLANQAKIDDLLLQVEEAMNEPDQDDSSFLMKVCTCHGSFYQLLLEFLSEVASRTDLDVQPVLRDRHVPWPAKAYYMLNASAFTVGLMYKSEFYATHLNREVCTFLGSDNMQQYRPDTPNAAYLDLQELSSSHSPATHSLQQMFELNDPIDPDEVIVGSKRSFSDIEGGDRIFECNEYIQELKQDDNQ